LVRLSTSDEGLKDCAGPEHDWSSHAANSFGLMAIAYEEPSRLASFNRELKYANPASFV
jgi:phage terminase large subunit